MSSDKRAFVLKGDRIGKLGVLGLGASGLSCLEYLTPFDVDVTAFDSGLSASRIAVYQAQYPEMAFDSDRFEQLVLSDFDALIISPGIDPRLPSIQQAVQVGVRLLGDMELFCLASKAPRIAITGSNAKTTVTTLVGRMVAQALSTVRVAGNIGVPVLTLLQGLPDQEPTENLLQGALGHDRDSECDVLELSSFQLETTENLSAEVAAVLNVSPDHMDRYDHFDDYTQVKQKIFHQAKKVVCNRNDKRTFPAHRLAGGQQIYSFGTDAPNDAFSAGVLKEALMFGEEKIVAIADLKKQGLLDIENALAAVAIASAFGVSQKVIKDVLVEFEGLSHRCQWVRKVDGVDWYNDSKGTNVGATIAAIYGLGQVDARDNPSIVLIAGGVSKGADFFALNDPIKRFVKKVFLIGEAASEIEQQLTEVDVKSVVLANSLNEAIALSRTEAAGSDIVLFSPACASFDMFKNYEDRGEQFMSAVRAL